MADLNLSAETKAEWERFTVSGIVSYTNMVDKVRDSIKMIDNVEQYIVQQGHAMPPENKHLRRLSECSMLVGLIWLDITAAFRIYLNAKERYEVIYAVKQLTITINEGFKQIYNYVSLDENGNSKTRERNQSFWVKDIGNIVKMELPHLLPEYEKITSSLDTYDDQELKDMKEPRNLFVHFDREASAVYDELQKQDIEKIARKALPFMNILTDMIKFNQLLLNEYNTIIGQRKNDMLNEKINAFESLRDKLGSNPDALGLLDQVQSFLKNHKIG